MVDKSHIGHLFDVTKARVEAGRLRAFLNAIGDTNPIFRDAAVARAAGYREIPVPPTYLFCLEMLDAAEPFAFINALGIDIAHLLHGEQTFNYHEPAYLGDVLLFRSRVADIIEKRSGAMTFVTQDTAVTLEDGTAVADLRRILIVRRPEPRS